MKIRLLIVLCVCVGTFALTFAQTSPAEALFQKGLLLERSEGNVAQAIVLYERVIAEYPKDPVAVPRAMSHLAAVYERTDVRRATQLWARLVEEFRATSYAEDARRKLAGVQATTAGPFAMRMIDVADGQLDEVDSELSPDGLSFVYIRPDTGGDRLIIRDARTGRDREVFREAGAALNDVDWSPDGTRLTFLVSDKPNRSAPGLGGEDLRMFTVATGRVRSLAKRADGQYYWWSPDNEHIVAHLAKTDTAPEGLLLISALTGASRTVVAPVPSMTAWSPDGRELAYSTRTGQEDAFWIASADGTNVRGLPMPLKVTGAGDRVNLANGVTNDHAWLTKDCLVVRQLEPGGASFYLIPLSGGAPTRTCTNRPGQRQCNMLTPDASLQVATNEADRRLLLLDLVRGGERRVTTTFGDEMLPAMSEDGRMLAFVSNAPGKWALNVAPLDATPVSSPVKLTDLDEVPQSMAAHAWTRDGRFVVNLAYADQNVYRIAMDGLGRATGAAARLTHDSTFAGSPAISPEGGRVAYRFQSGTKSGVALMSVEGTGERLVFEGPATEHVEWFSADEVLFNNAAVGSPSTVAALNVKTGAVRPFADYATGFGWQYVPSRGELVYLQGPAGPRRSLRARSLKDGSDREIAVIDAIWGARSPFRVSPDGRFIAYGTRGTELHIMTIDGRDDRVVATGHPWDWSPDGRFVIYDSPGVLRVLDVRSGESWPIAEATDDARYEWSVANWAPDGTFIVIARSGWRERYRSFEGVTYDAVVRQMASRRR